MSGTRTDAAAYRPDIDGLRAIAVLAVIGFHAGIRTFTGGYVGVDIFFVISGFLITSIICKNLDRGTFSFRDFYARRAKRIFPALVVLLLVVSAYGWFILLPGEFEHLGKHVVAGAGFISNLMLWSESGYFDKTTEAKPLLHLWSLGIEEQFYLLWPPLLVWIWRRKADVLSVAVGIVAISFAVNVMLVSLWQSSDAYYLPPTRFWELLLGSALAYLSLFRKLEFENTWNRKIAHVPSLESFAAPEIRAAAGLLFIFISIFGLSQQTAFPGWWGLLPTAGTVLVISAGPEAWINRKLLSSRPLVFIGLISYSLYLWHWPLLSFAHIIEPGPLPVGTIAGAVVLAFVLAWLTFLAIEKPLRSKPNLWAFPCASALAVCACLGLFVCTHQVHARSESYGLGAIIGVEHASWDFPGQSLKAFQTPLGYHFERGGAASRVLFIGDSHVQQYYPRIDRLLIEHPDSTRSIAFVTALGCPPLSRVEELVHPKCKGLMKNAFAVADDLKVDAVVLAAAWNRYDAFAPDGPDAAYRDLESTIVKFRTSGKQVYLVLPIPKGDSFEPSRIVKRGFTLSGFSVVSRMRLSEVDPWGKRIAAKLRSVADSHGAVAIDPVDYICPDGDCPTLAHDGLPRYGDESHLRPNYVRQELSFLDDIVLTGNTSGLSVARNRSGNRPF
jgi:peptidoglycan/LPS O-acetylase OafA/YrhL